MSPSLLFRLVLYSLDHREQPKWRRRLYAMSWGYRSLAALSKIQ